MAEAIRWAAILDAILVGLALAVCVFWVVRVLQPGKVGNAERACGSRKSGCGCAKNAESVKEAGTGKTEK
jgi:hypothetical protein